LSKVHNKTEISDTPYALVYVVYKKNTIAKKGQYCPLDYCYSVIMSSLFRESEYGWKITYGAERHDESKSFEDDETGSGSE